MADAEKQAQEVVSSTTPDNGLAGLPKENTRPEGWKYKPIKIGPFTFPWYASPPVQLLIVSLVCFLCPGMFNALSGTGGGGQVDPIVADHANTALYSVFAVVGFFAGTVCNKLGVKTSLSIGGLGYCLYEASFLCYSHTQNDGFTIFAGAFLGLCAGLLWTAQGAIMMSYPREELKGRYISAFWVIFNLGAVIGALIPLGQNAHVETKSAVSDGTYIGFIVLTLLGAILAWTLVNSKDVIRDDGSKVIVMKNPTWKSELIGLFETFREEPWIIFLFPMFFASNWFYQYQFNDVNAAVFNTRTRALNNLMYWLFQIFGAGVFGVFLDLKSLRRPTKAIIAWCAIFVLTMVIWGGGYAFQDYTREDVEDGSYEIWDWTRPGYGGPLALYFMYGFFDAAWQCYVYWTMGSLSNNARKLANFAGFYKGIQSVGAAVSFSIDFHGAPYINIFASCWALLAGSLVVALPLVVMKIKDTVPLEEDIKFTDETIEEVVPQVRRGSAADVVDYKS